MTFDSYTWGVGDLLLISSKFTVRTLSWSDGFQCIGSFKSILLHETNVVEGYSMDGNRILCLNL